MLIGYLCIVSGPDRTRLWRQGPSVVKKTGAGEWVPCHGKHDINDAVKTTLPHSKECEGLLSYIVTP